MVQLLLLLYHLRCRHGESDENGMEGEGIDFSGFKMGHMDEKKV